MKVSADKYRDDVLEALRAVTRKGQSATAEDVRLYMLRKLGYDNLVTSTRPARVLASLRDNGLVSRYGNGWLPVEYVQ